MKRYVAAILWVVLAFGLTACRELYTGTHRGVGFGEVAVEVTIYNGMMRGIDVTAPDASPEALAYMQAIADVILLLQNLAPDSIEDTMIYTGAVIEAVANALESAGLELPEMAGLMVERPVTERPVSERPGTAFAPGEFTGRARGYYSEIIVTVTINEAGEIANIEVAPHHETIFIGGIAIDESIRVALEYGPEHVEVIAGATVTVEAFIRAMEQALEQSREKGNGGVLEEIAGGFTPGEFTGRARGYYSEIIVTVTINEAGEIANIEVAPHHETIFIGGIAIDESIRVALEYGPEHVEVIAGATVTVEAFIRAMEQALDQATE